MLNAKGGDPKVVAAGLRRVSHFAEATSYAPILPSGLMVRRDYDPLRDDAFERREIVRCSRRRIGAGEELAQNR